MMAKGLPPFETYYDEKLKVGYKWYDAEKKPVLFPFGFGLSYTTYAYSGLTVKNGERSHRFLHREEHRQARGTEIAQVYTSFPEAAGEPPKRLIGWARVDLAPGESKPVTITDRPRTANRVRRSHGCLEARPRQLQRNGGRFLPRSAPKQVRHSAMKQ